MPGVLGDILVLSALAAAAVLAARSLWREHRSGGCCGDCSKCGGCHGSCRSH